MGTSIHISPADIRRVYFQPFVEIVHNLLDLRPFHHAFPPPETCPRESKVIIDTSTLNEEG